MPSSKASGLISDGNIYASPDGCDVDPPLAINFTVTIILNNLSQVQKNIDELSKTYLVGKMLGNALDIRTIISKLNLTRSL